MAAQTNHIFNFQDELVASLPHVADDGNHGLPEWYFDGDFYHVEEHDDFWEWIPAMGPAPCWKATKAEIPEITGVPVPLRAWIKVTY